MDIMKEMDKVIREIAGIEDMEDFVDIGDNDDLETYLAKYNSEKVAI